MSESRMHVADFEVLVADLDHPEGVAWGLDGHVYASGEAGQLYRVTLSGACTQFADTGGFNLGLCLDAHCNVYVCNQGRHAVMRVTPTGVVSPYCNGTPERPMVTPNYPVFDTRGNLYVSDSGGWRQNNGCLFRVRATGQVEMVSDAVCQFPNGMALSPDGTALFIVLTTSCSVVKVALAADGTVGLPELVVQIPRTVPDGLAFDMVGNLYISCYAPSVVYRLSPAGELSVLVEDWESTMIAGPINLAFCGADLSTLVLGTVSRWHLARATVHIPGHPLAYPCLDGIRS